MFTELPRELRDLIWSLAIRDDHPGAHIFGQYVTGSRRLQSRDSICFDLTEPSWRRFNHEELFKTATSGNFDGTPLERVTVFPLRDLFIVQHEDLDNIYWDGLDFDLALASIREGFYGVEHIAIEYDRAWADGPCNDDAIFTFSQACVGVTYTLWFLDRSLKRKSQAPVFEEESEPDWKINAFYASDRKFLEIKDYSTLLKDWNISGRWKPIEAELDEQKITDGSEAEDHCFVKLLGWAPF
ncbi:hypothetical protein FMEXI_11321 [Fusarium mexicanum]|uniref:Uncharacterized protein n=1 Tax=Fusarium mexicanum TaxID=751941 RepID=A0A8H5IBZ0_9HYPO|nr:hypothetical protein FMEXI_11321 [Fusarium mexicanum]